MDTYLESVKDLFAKGIPPRLEKINEYFMTLDITDASKISKYSKFKGILKKIDPSNVFLSKMYLPEDIRISVRNSNVANAKKDITDIKKSTIGKIKKLKTSDLPEDQLLFIALVTGRRSTEIKNLYLKKGPKNSIEFSGQLKTADKTSYNIPILCPFKVLQNSLKIINDSGLEFDTVSKRALQKLKCISGLADITVHNLRQVYVILAYAKDDLGLNFPVFIEKVLGHHNGSSASKYQTFRII